jgi:Oxidoreductase family, NAD-binding Rossmann fold
MTRGDSAQHSTGPALKEAKRSPARTQLATASAVAGLNLTRHLTLQNNDQAVAQRDLQASWHLVAAALDKAMPKTDLRAGGMRTAFIWPPVPSEERRSLQRPSDWHKTQCPARIIAVCDLDSKRVEQGKTLVNGYYAKAKGKPYAGVTGYRNYHDLLANKDIDAVVISTPDHQHAIVAVDAVRANKDGYLQKPASLTIAQGRVLSNAVQASGRILQIGSQQRSWKQFTVPAN